jgi:hypothetical protein
MGFPRTCRLSSPCTRPVMLDVIFLALGVAGFAVCLGFVYLCELL